MSVHSSANQWGFIRGIFTGSLETGPSGAVNSLSERRLIFSNVSEKNRRAESGEDPTGRAQVSIIGAQIGKNSGNLSRDGDDGNDGQCQTWYVSVKCPPNPDAKIINVQISKTLTGQRE